MSAEFVGLEDFGTIRSSAAEPEWVKLDDFEEKDKVKLVHSTKSLSSLEACTKCTGDKAAVCTTDKGLEVLNYAARFGRRSKLSKSEWVTWALRLEIERGEQTPYPVNAPPLPAGVSTITAKVYHGFIQLLECRWRHLGGEGAPAPFTYDFAAAWCGVTERQAKEARRELVRIKALVHVGTAGRAKLWLPRKENE